MHLLSKEGVFTQRVNKIDDILIEILSEIVFNLKVSKL